LDNQLMHFFSGVMQYASVLEAYRFEPKIIPGAGEDGLKPGWEKCFFCTGPKFADTAADKLQRLINNLVCTTASSPGILLCPPVRPIAPQTEKRTFVQNGGTLCL
jgi:hypothetical protein